MKGRPGLQVVAQFAARRPWVPSAAALRRWARAAHRAAAERRSRTGRGAVPPAATVCVRIVGTAASRRLNAGYRGKDRPTNVLSFPAAPVERDLDGSLGDLVICAPVVAAEARAQHKALAEHWAHMVVHGVLHLHGYDHVKARQARLMEGLEVEILRGFGYQDPYRPVTSPNHER
jgi:probable rRNA maturation factor